MWDHVGGISEASRRHLRGISEASERLGWPRGVLEVKIVESGTPLQRHAKLPVTFQFDDVFLRVGVSNHCKLQRKKMAGSVSVLAPAPWALLINTVTNPADKSVRGIILSFPSPHCHQCKIVKSSDRKAAFWRSCMVIN